ncbi:MAG: hypothetical protein AAGJ28_22580 [Pseudomonadota bacterium]
MTKKIETTFDFYAQQYFAHLGKVRDLHEERTAMMRYAVVGTFAYYAWLFNNPDFMARHAEDLQVLAPIWMMPLVLNAFGLWRNRILLRTIDKHGGFLSYLTKNALNCENHFSTYKRERGFEGRGIHHSRIFWKAILVVCAIAGSVGISTVSAMDPAIACDCNNLGAKE